MDQVATLAQYPAYPFLELGAQTVSNLTSRCVESMHSHPYVWIIGCVGSMLVGRVATFASTYFISKSIPKVGDIPPSYSDIVAEYKSGNVLQDRRMVVKLFQKSLLCSLQLPLQSKYTAILDDLRSRLPQEADCIKAFNAIGSVYKGLSELNQQTEKNHQQTKALRVALLQEIDNLIHLLQEMLALHPLRDYQFIEASLHTDDKELKSQKKIEPATLLRHLKGVDEWWLFKETYRLVIDQLFSIHPYVTILTSVKSHLQKSLDDPAHESSKAIQIEELPVVRQSVELPPVTQVGEIHSQILQTLHNIEMFFSSSFSQHLVVTDKIFPYYMKEIMSCSDLQKQQHMLKVYREISDQYLKTCTSSATQFSHMQLTHVEKAQCIYSKARAEFIEQLKAITELSKKESLLEGVSLPPSTPKQDLQIAPN